MSPFKPGHSGNPGGRPKGASLRRLLIEKYGADSRVLIERLDELSRQRRSPKTAVDALRLLLAYVHGEPRHHFQHDLRRPVPMFVLPPDTRVDFGLGPGALPALPYSPTGDDDGGAVECTSRADDV